MQISTFSLTVTLACSLPITPLFAQEQEAPKAAEKKQELTPVEATVKSLILELFDSLDQNMAPPKAQREQIIIQQILPKFRKKAPKWTKQDAKKLKAGKQLVKDFDETVKNFIELTKDEPETKWLREKIQQKDLTDLEKRTFQDLYILVQSQVKRSRATQAINNAKDINVAIRDYVIKNGFGLGDLGDKKSANEVLRLLFENGDLDDEKPFFVKGVKGFNEGDGNIVGKQALAAGENVWAINAGVNVVTAKANTPLLLCPLKMVKGKLVADPEPFDGQVVVLYADGSAQVHKIGPKGEIMTDDGPLYSTKHPVWRDKEGRFTPPDFRLPEPLPKAKKK